MKIKGFITHKLRENFSDCQDRFGVNTETKSLAVSDGMGSTWHQKIWADLLVSTFVNNGEWVPNLQSVKELSSVWRSRVIEYIQQLKEIHAKENLIFRNERNLSSGKSAGATFCGVRFTNSHWDCDVLGDSCLIEFNKQDINFYTSQDTEKFDNFPDYYDSDEKKDGVGTIKHFEGELSDDTILFMVSDPFSDFLLESKKNNKIKHYIEDLLKLSSHNEFEALVYEWRKLGMHNDDTTLIIIEPDESDKFDVVYADDILNLIKSENGSADEKQITQSQPVDSKNVGETKFTLEGPVAVSREDLEGVNVNVQNLQSNDDDIKELKEEIESLRKENVALKSDRIALNHKYEDSNNQLVKVKEILQQYEGNKPYYVDNYEINDFVNKTYERFNKRKRCWFPHGLKLLSMDEAKDAMNFLIKQIQEKYKIIKK